MKNNIKNNEEKILILTLGTGGYIEGKKEGEKEIPWYSLPTEEQRRERLREIYDLKKFSYKQASYVLPYDENVKNKKIESEFVAEPLIFAEKPDQVIIIGTVRSCWSGFYNKFADEDKNCFENFWTLADMEQKYGIDTEMEELKEKAETIERIFNEDGVLNSIVENSIKIHIFLIRYGLNDAELQENYTIISSMQNYFVKGVHYKISFDITHSFRSLPIYNLVILFFIKYVTQYDVEISHVFYGNLDVRRETEKAYIIDLKDLIHVLELTNGVGEFRDTGNAVALLKEVKDTELRTTLEEFDWATQINDYDRILESLGQLYQAIGTAGGGGTRYTDLNEMLGSVLSNEFISEEGLSVLKDIQTHPENLGELQLRICKWYQHQNRYGLAIATALEALRSFLVPIYLKSRKNMSVNLESCKNENNRKAAESALNNLYNNVRKGAISENSIQADLRSRIELLCKIEKSRRNVKPIRNRFAHNLSGNKKEQKYSLEEFKQDKGKIDAFIGCLDDLSRELRGSCDLISKAYYLRPEKKIMEKVGGDILLILSNKSSEVGKKGDFTKYKKSKSSKKKYKVYIPPFELCKKMSQNQKNKNYCQVIQEGFLLAKSISKCFDTTKLEVILEAENLNYLQKVYYPAILMAHGINKVFLEETSRKELREYKVIFDKSNEELDEEAKNLLAEMSGSDKWEEIK